MKNLDLGHIQWSQLPGFDNFDYCVLSVDRPNKLVDVLFHFHENDPIVLHRHCAVNHTFVISGEHRLFHANGELKDVRPTGSYTISQPDTTPHRECGGEGGTLVLFSIRGTEGVMYEILDDQENLIAVFDMDTFAALQAANAQ